MDLISYMFIISGTILLIIALLSLLISILIKGRK